MNDNRRISKGRSKKKVRRKDGRMNRKLNLMGEGKMKRGESKGKREERIKGEGWGNSDQHRNISLSIRRKTRWMPYLTAASFKGVSTHVFICILFKYLCKTENL